MRKIIASAVAVAVMAGMCAVSASEQIVNLLQPAVEGSSVTISGKLEGGYMNNVAYYVVNTSDETARKYAIGEIYIDSEDGSFSQSFEMSDTAQSGKYKLVLAAVKSDSSIEAEYDYVSVQVRSDLVAQITADSTSGDDVIALLENSDNINTLKAMACLSEDYSAMNTELKKNVVTLIKNNLGGYFTAPYTEEEFKELFNYTVAYTATVTDKTAVVADMLKKYETVFGIDTSGIVPGTYLTEKIRKAPANSTENIKKTYDEAHAVIAFNNVIDYKAVEGLIDTYKDIAGLDLTKYNSLGSKKSAVWKAMLGGGYDTPNDIKSRFDKAVIDAGKTTTTGGGGGSSSGSSGGGSDISVQSAVISAKPQNEEKQSFTDINGYEWAEEAIYALADNRIINGTAEGIFEPGRSITREEFVKILVSAFSFVNTSAECNFDDVNESDWYYVYVASAVEKGIVKGKSENQFGAGVPVTRQEIAVLLMRAAETAGISLSEIREIEFADSAEFADFASDSIMRLANAGIINGKSDKLFAPNDNATRAEAAKLIWELWKSV